MLWLHTPSVFGKRRSIKEVKEKRRYSLGHKMLYLTAQSHYLYVSFLQKLLVSVLVTSPQSLTT